MEAAAAHLLDFSKPFDCTLLDQIVLISQDPKHPHRSGANEFLVRMKDHPDMWRRADAILESSQQAATKFFGLQVLTEAINTHWKVIPQEQREGIRNYIITKIIQFSSSDESMAKHHQYLSRLNLVLIQILKQDWPHNWPTFISDIVMASKASESLCENNMKVLQLLSEEIFDFSKESMTANKIKLMKESLNDEFSQIFTLCEFILEASTKPSLIICTLQTLQRFLTWIPLGYIFETNLVMSLITKFLKIPQYRTATIDCLTEIAALSPNDIPDTYKPSMRTLFVTFIHTLSAIIPIHSPLKTIYETANETDQLFLQRLGWFFVTYFKSYFTYLDHLISPSHLPLTTPLYSTIPTLDKEPALLSETKESILMGLIYLLHISDIPEEELFKTCLEFWFQYCKELYTYDLGLKMTSSSNVNMTPNVNSNSYLPSFGSLTPSRPVSKHSIYDDIIHQLRILLIDHMAKPEEVIIVEDENGEIVREMTKDTEVIAQYKTMRETLVYLTHLHYEDTEGIMLEKLDLQVAGGMFSWQGLNTLCWAVGSISGAMGELDEKRFLVSVIKDLLRLCEEVKGKDNKAVVASNIMYIVGQYPRFLRAHWKFLKTVVNKLFEFMHEYHPGVQDMACDTFLKIAQKCKRKFMTLQVEDNQPFILTLISDLGRHIMDLQPHQIQSFYESVATMLSDYGPQITLVREEVIIKLMELPNNTWKSIMTSGNNDINTLLSIDTMRELSKIIKINTKVCHAAGTVYYHQFSLLFQDMLHVYRLYSDQIKAGCAAQGNIAVRLTNYKAMRHVKTDILELWIACLEILTTESIANEANNTTTGTNNTTSNGNGNNSGILIKQKEIFYTNFLPSLLSDCLLDYHSSPPPARDYHILSLFSQAIVVYKTTLSSDIPRMMEHIFEKTLEMITMNMLDYPEHRIQFFTFLRYANLYCFHGLFSIPTMYIKLIIDSILWAMKHTERNISETGLEILYELLQNIGNSNTQSLSAHNNTNGSDMNSMIVQNNAQGFYANYLILLTTELFGILTDRLHKSGFKLQTNILKSIVQCIALGQVLIPLNPSSQTVVAQATMSQLASENITYFSETIHLLLTKAFPNVPKATFTSFITNLFELSQSNDVIVFKQLIRDFLITIKEFANEDNSELFLEENEELLAQRLSEEAKYRASVPGLLRPSEQAYEEPQE